MNQTLTNGKLPWLWISNCCKKMIVKTNRDSRGSKLDHFHQQGALDHDTSKSCSQVQCKYQYFVLAILKDTSTHYSYSYTTCNLIFWKTNTSRPHTVLNFKNNFPRKSSSFSQWFNLMHNIVQSVSSVTLDQLTICICVCMCLFDKHCSIL